MFSIYSLSRVIEAVEKIMETDNCRMHDSDILRALRRVTFDINNLKGLFNIKLCTKELPKNC